jgi:uncharacterized cofD-like protein
VKIRNRIRPALRWLVPGMHVKRWLLLLLAGTTIVGLGVAYLLREVYVNWTFPPVFYYLTLQFIGRAWRGLLFGFLGLGAIAVAIYQLNRSLLSAFLQPGQEDVADTVYKHWQRDRGPKVVAIGGGTGLSTLLRGLKEHTSNITAIVTVADDGGSSGRLRRQLGVLPPGDFRNCLAALANAESLTTQLFQYRFGEGEGLNGHSFGNLFIVAMAGVTGNFERALLESSKVLAVRGQILPSTLENATLVAELRDEGEEGQSGEPQWVEGESQIPESGRPIDRVFLQPGNVSAYPGALRAILDADLIVAGPGSLYTSILPNLLVEDILKAVRASRAKKIYVCNVATQRGETEGYTLGDHMAALHRHVGVDVFSNALANNNFTCVLPDMAGVAWVPTDHPSDASYRVFAADLVDREFPWRHDPAKLTRWLMAFCENQQDVYNQNSEL